MAACIFLTIKPFLYMINSILAPTDFSLNAKHAVLYAAELAVKAKSKLTILNAYHLLHGPHDYPKTIDHIPTESDIKQRSMQKLYSLKRLVIKKFPKLKVDLVAEHGMPVETILYSAKNVKADLIVMGTLGMSGVSSVLFGRNTLRMIRSAYCPVLAVPKRSKVSNVKKVLYASDLSEGETDVMKRLIAFASVWNASVKIVYINRPGQDRMKSRLLEVSKKTRYKKVSIEAIENESVVNGIEIFLKEQKSDILALAHRPRTFFEDLFHVSVTKQLSLNINLPLLVIPK